MQRIITVALGVALALAALVSVSAQPSGPDHNFYGLDAMPGDVITAMDADGNELGSDTVDENGDWNIEVDPSLADDVSFAINGEAAEGEQTSRGQILTQVSGLAVAETMLDEGMEGDEDGEMMDEDGEMMEDEDSMMDEDGDSMMDEGDTGYPATGTGGLASDGGVSAGLIGLLIALVTVSVAGLGLRRIRNRA